MGTTTATAILPSLDSPEVCESVGLARLAPVVAEVLDACVFDGVVMGFVVVMVCITVLPTPPSVGEMVDTVITVVSGAEEVNIALDVVGMDEVVGIELLIDVGGADDDVGGGGGTEDEDGNVVCPVDVSGGVAVVGSELAVAPGVDLVDGDGDPSEVVVTGGVLVVLEMMKFSNFNLGKTLRLGAMLANQSS